MLESTLVIIVGIRDRLLFLLRSGAYRARFCKLAASLN
jgi:hypothetical protein